MARKGREFELKYKWLYELDKEKYTVTSPAKVYDKASKNKREVDVLVEYMDDEGFTRKISIECRDRKSIVDVTGIEQLLKKKDDMGLDYLIVATTKNFSQGAINKANYYGVIIEQAEMLNKDSIENITKKFYADFFFFRIELTVFTLFTQNMQILSLKDYLKGKNILEQSEILKHINGTFYFSIDFNEIFQNGKIKEEDFFANEDNSIEMSGRYDIWGADFIPSSMKDVCAFEWKIRAIPYKVSLPIEDSLSVFDGESRKNKNYCARFGDDNEYFETGYLDGKSFSNLKLKPRKYFRFAGARLHLNTVFPDGIDMPKPDFDFISKNLIGEFDMSDLLK